LVALETSYLGGYVPHEIDLLTPSLFDYTLHDTVQTQEPLLLEDFDLLPTDTLKHLQTHRVLITVDGFSHLLLEADMSS
jgi:hypothetical protein